MNAYRKADRKKARQVRRKQVLILILLAILAMLALSVGIWLGINYHG